MNAQAALTHSRGFDRIGQFPSLTEWFGKALAEIKRLRSGRATLIAEALGELNALMTTQLEDALRKHGDLLSAVHEFRERNYFLRRDDDGCWRWTPRPDSDIHEAIEKLARAAVAAQ